ncbi:unnamed protein product [Paramecium sonneborni]|uniref:Uncharacterized protein n=1 Tax=Paramecium sonneborni TaxID=65129 RepID=A0A8S1PR96_9CILI|nr:unnamed protein product [Paramecium sonneborni]
MPPPIVYTKPEIIGITAIQKFSIIPNKPKAVANFNNILKIPNISSGTVDYKAGIKILEKQEYDNPNVFTQRLNNNQEKLQKEYNKTVNGKQKPILLI